MTIKLLKISKSSRTDKKLMAYFNHNNRIKIVHFGAAGYMDYTLFKDRQLAEKRKKLYIQRHRNDHLNDPMSPGALSMYILWNKPSISASIQDYKNRFKL